MSDLDGIVDTEKSTTRQRQVVRAALEGWAQVETRRAYFAHGVTTALLDRNEIWHAQLDFVAYRGSQAESCRWNLSRSEADAFEAQLTQSFKQLSTELGQLKRRFAV